MSKNYLYKVWFTSIVVNPFLFAFLYGLIFGKYTFTLFTGDVSFSKADKSFLDLLAVVLANLAFVMFLALPVMLLLSLPILLICITVQNYLAKKTDSEIPVRICIVLIATLVSFIAGKCINDLAGLYCAVVCFSSVLIASMYHSFRDRLNSYS